ncbi:hypothetical protein [Endozoicomonas sp.]|uniref:hypothetical protein n=1 Tax=Endozoicomonas sp. TaxID=1892382 RepID=UPI0028861374|nr:hypothetical protein [Endozoicomonas sp.]
MQEDKKIRQANQDFSITAEQRPSRHRSTGNAPKSAGKPAPTSKSNGAGYFVSGVLFVLLAGVAAGGYWQVAELQKTLVDIRQALQETRDQLGLVTGQVSQTGETINQSDSIFRSELKVVNSEIRKLWDVSNKRNRQAINENKEKIEQGGKKLDLAIKQSDAAIKQSDAARKSAGQQVSKLTVLDQMIKAVTSEQLVANSDMTAHVEALKAEIDGLKSRLSAQKAVEQQVQASTQTQEELSKKLSAFQSQISLRLQQLENSMRDLGKPKDNGLTIQ